MNSFHSSSFDEPFLDRIDKDSVIISLDDLESQTTKKRASKLLKSTTNKNGPTPGEAENGVRSSFGRERSSSGNVLWILVRLEEMGVKIDSETVTKMIMNYSAEPSRDFIIEAILQNEFEKVEEEEEKDARNRQDGSDPRAASVYGYSLDSEIGYKQPFKCDLCAKSLEGDLYKHPFKCFAHRFCHSCLLKKFGQRIKDGEDIETFVCPEESCKKQIMVDGFMHLVPEVDFKELGELEIGTCPICFDDIKGNETLLKIFDCQAHFFCYNCTLDYLKEAISNRKAQIVLDLKCPDSSCGALLCHNKMKNLVPTYLFNRYSRYRNNALIERDPNLRWCTRPGCENIIKRTNGNLKARCVCGQLTCMGCGNPWHNKKTCEQALEEEYKLFAKQEGIQFCPECKSRVEKSTGCNHMTCPICTYQWCWLCGGEYTSRHFDMLNPLGCPGLQSEDHSKKKWSKCKLIAYKSMFIILAILLLPLAPVAAVIAAILVPNWICNSYIDYSCFVNFMLRTLLTILGVILLPLTIVVAVVGAIVPGTCYLAKYLLDRHNDRTFEKKRRREMILKRLKKVEPQEKLENHRKSIILENGNNQNMLSRPLLEPDISIVQRPLE